MRLFSTPFSADRGEITVFALIETALAVATSAYIAWTYETFYHIAFSATVAPFFLLRTKRSTVLGIQMTKDCLAERFSMGIEVTKVSALPAVFLGITYASIFRGLWHRPLRSILSIPFNWKRICLCVDFAYPPEVVPGWQRRSGGALTVGRFLRKLPSFLDLRTKMFTTEWYENAENIHPALNRFVVPILFTFIYVAAISYGALIISVAYLLSIFYRVMMKSSAIVWSPLLWVVWNSSSTDPAQYRLEDIKHSSFQNTVRMYSLFWLFLAFLKILAVFKFINTVPLPSWLTPTLRLPLWEIGTFFNSVAVWLLLIFADIQIRKRRFRSPSALPDETITRILNGAGFARSAIGVYIAICMLIIAWSVEWPKLDVPLVP